MIIYGWNTKGIKNAPYPHYECPNCQTKDSTHLFFFGHYAHIFWIPLFPYKKSAASKCQQCGYEQELKHMAADAKTQVSALKKSLKYPWYMFAGLMLIAVFAGIVAFSSAQDAQATEAYYANPMVGDVYTVYHADEPTIYKWGFLKIDSVTTDSLYLVANILGYNKKSSSLSHDDSYEQDKFMFSAAAYSRDTVSQMIANDVIRDVDRGYSSGHSFNRCQHLESRR